MQRRVVSKEAAHERREHCRMGCALDQLTSIDQT